MRRVRHFYAVLAVAQLAACASLTTRQQYEALALLSPASLGAEATATQRLRISRESGGRVLVLDAALQIDARELRVAGLLLGQRVLLLAWDGARVQESRDPAVPASLSGRAILRDLQLLYWPAEVIRAALPPGWRLEENAARRRLFRGATAVFESVRSDARIFGGATLWNHVDHYRIDIEASS